MRILRLLFKLILTGILLAIVAIGSTYFYFSQGLHEIQNISEYQPPLVSRIYNFEGELLAEYADEHRILTPFEAIPLHVRQAFLAAEDEHFYQHPGINPPRILAAALANLQAGRTIQGGSTITQQVAKNLFLSSERTYSRKIRELILTYRLENSLSKDDILYLYLNHIYLGRGAYGVASAAWRYFGKELDQLTIAECAMIAGLPKAPGKYAPHLSEELAISRRNVVIGQMLAAHFITAEESRAAMIEPITVAPLFRNKLDNAYGQEIYHQIEATVGIKALRNQGLTLFVPYQDAAQQAAIHAVRNGLLDIEARQFYRQPVQHARAQWVTQYATWRDAYPVAKGEALQTYQIVPAMVEKVRDNGDLEVNDGMQRWLIAKPRWQWEKLDTAANDSPLQRTQRHWLVGDEIVLRGNGNGGVMLSQQPSIESSLYSVDLKKGTMIARVGGFDFNFGDFDRVSQANRQPGSAFKPFLYATAIESGYTPASIIMDTPLVFDQNSSDLFWRPENYKNIFAGAVTLRNALEHSRNLASIKLLQDVGPERFIEKLRDFSFTKPMPAQLSIALGTAEVTLEQLTEAYIPFASGGERWKPISIEQIQDRNGNTLMRSVSGNRCQVCHVDPVLPANHHMQASKQVLDSTSSFIMTNILKGVVDRGTGQGARALNRPAAGKTGTTNNQVDAWFMGYTPQILTGVWTGRDIPTPMGRRETGARAALPTWLMAMKAFHQDRPVEHFEAPAGVEWVYVDPETGARADQYTATPFLESFRVGTAPDATSSPEMNKQSLESKEFYDHNL
ncbi:MAG: PBP1A family penicillin-binding protein [Zetaproteobacteria bacterium]|nr:PBP1A family penicillin-binding protein [Zetaproteobacteria bacterium]